MFFWSSGSSSCAGSRPRPARRLAPAASQHWQPSGKKHSLIVPSGGMWEVPQSTVITNPAARRGNPKTRPRRREPHSRASRASWRHRCRGCRIHARQARAAARASRSSPRSDRSGSAGARRQGPPRASSRRRRRCGCSFCRGGRRHTGACGVRIPIQRLKAGQNRNSHLTRHDYAVRIRIGLDTRDQPLELLPFSIPAYAGRHHSFRHVPAFWNIGKKLRCLLSLMTSLAPIVLAFRRSPPAGVMTCRSGFSMIAAWTSSACAGVALYMP